MRFSLVSLALLSLAVVGCGPQEQEARNSEDISPAPFAPPPNATRMAAEMMARGNRERAAADARQAEEMKRNRGVASFAPDEDDKPAPSMGGISPRPRERPLPEAGTESSRARPFTPFTLEGRPPARYSSFVEWRPEIVDGPGQSSGLNPAADPFVGGQQPFQLAARRTREGVRIWDPHTGERADPSGNLRALLTEDLGTPDEPKWTFLAYFPQTIGPTFQPVVEYFSAGGAVRVDSEIIEKGRKIRFWLTRDQVQRAGSIVTLNSDQPSGAVEGVEMTGMKPGDSRKGYLLRSINREGSWVTVDVEPTFTPTGLWNRSVAFLDKEGREVIPTSFEVIGRRNIAKFSVQGWSSVVSFAELKHTTVPILFGRSLAGPSLPRGRGGK